MELNDFSLIRICADYQIKPFDCDDSDLNDFFLNDAKLHLEELLSVTYVVESEDKTVAFFSLLNDKISITDVDSNNLWNRLRKSLANRKRFKSYPAIKIGRLGVHVDFKYQKIGSKILDYIKIWFIEKNKTGCKFITVDAYDKSLEFYEKNGFLYLTESDVGKDTRLMYFDLKKLTQ